MNKLLQLNTFVVMNFPSKVVENAVEHLSRLPGIGKRTALRLTLHILKQRKETISGLGNSITELSKNINYCSNCFSISEDNLCEICKSPHRDKSTICIVEDIRVLLAIENTMQFKGVYHVLGGLISPMNGIGPSDIRTKELLDKVETTKIKEIIFALSTTMEGDTTNYYLFRHLSKKNIKISSIARGIAIGDELEYTDQLTLATAISSRMPYENSYQNS